MTFLRRFCRIASGFDVFRSWRLRWRYSNPQRNISMADNCVHISVPPCGLHVRSLPDSSRRRAGLCVGWAGWVAGWRYLCHVAGQRVFLNSCKIVLWQMANIRMPFCRTTHSSVQELWCPRSLTSDGCRTLLHMTSGKDVVVA
jgi:hypothetical protein